MISSGYRADRGSIWVVLGVGALALAVHAHHVLTGDGLAALLAGAAPIGLALAAVFQFEFLALFFVVSAFRLHEAIPHLQSLKIPLLLGLLSLVGFAFHLIFSRERDFRLPRQVVLALVFFAWATASVAFAYDKPAAWMLWSGTVNKLAIMVLAFALVGRTTAHLQILYWLMVGSGLTLAVIAVKNKLLGIDLVEGTRAIVTAESESVLGDPNYVAMLILGPLALALALLFCNRSRLVRALAASSALIMIAGVIATQSRGGLLGTLAMLAVLLLRTIRSRAVMLGIIAVAGVALVSFMGLSSRMSGSTSVLIEQGLDDSALHRTEAWRAAVDMATTRPIFGVGIGGFRSAYYQYATHWRGRAIDVHSTWFSLLSEVGVIGFALFVTMIATTIRSFYRVLESQESGSASALEDGPPVIANPHVVALGCYAGLIGVCVSSSFITNAFSWVIFAYVALSAIFEARLAKAPQHVRNLRSSNVGAHSMVGDYNLRTVIGWAWRRKWYLIVPIVVGAPLAVLAAILAPKTYVAKSLLALQENSADAPLAREIRGFEPVGEKIAGLQALLQSNRLISDVLTDLHGPGFAANAKMMQLARKDFQRAVSLNPVGGEFIELSYKAGNPEGMGRVLSIVIERLMGSVLTNEGVSSSIPQFVLKRLQVRRLEAERQLNLFVAHRDAGTLPARSALGDLPAKSAALAKMRQEFVALLKSDLGPNAEPGAFAALAEDRRRKAAQLTGDKVAIDPARAEALRAHLAELERGITLETQYYSLLLDVDFLQMLAAAPEKARSEAAIDYQKLLTERAASAKEAHESWQKRFGDASVTGLSFMRAPERIVVVDQPRDPDEPVTSRRVIFLMGLLASVAMGIGLAVLAELFDTRVRTARRLTQATGTPVLAYVNWQTIERQAPRPSAHGT